MGIKQLYNDNLRKLPSEYEDVSVMFICQIKHCLLSEFREKRVHLFVYSSDCVVFPCLPF